MRRAVMSIAAVAILALVWAPGRAAASANSAPPTWSAPVKALPGHWWYGMSMAADSHGHVHIAASGWKNGAFGLWYATDRSGGWVRHKLLGFTSLHAWVRPSLAIDGSNSRVHIAVDRMSCVECTVADAYGVWELSDVGRARDTFPSQPTRLTPNGTAQGALAVNAGHVFVAYAGNPDAGFTSVSIRTKQAGAWITHQLAAAGREPALALGPDGQPWVAYRRPSDVRLARATSSAGTFSTWTIPGAVAGHDGHAMVAVAPSGVAHVAWMRASAMGWTVLYVKRTLVGWSAVRNLTPGYDEALTVGLDGKPHVFVEWNQFLEYRLSGGAFTESVVAAGSGGSYAGMAIDADPGGTTHVAWADLAGNGVMVAHD